MIYLVVPRHLIIISQAGICSTTGMSNNAYLSNLVIVYLTYRIKFSDNGQLPETANAENTSQSNGCLNGGNVSLANGRPNNKIINTSDKSYSVGCINISGSGSNTSSSSAIIRSSNANNVGGVSTGTNAVPSSIVSATTSNGSVVTGGKSCNNVNAASSSQNNKNGASTTSTSAASSSNNNNNSASNSSRSECNDCNGIGGVNSSNRPTPAMNGTPPLMNRTGRTQSNVNGKANDNDKSNDVTSNEGACASTSDVNAAPVEEPLPPG